MRIDTDIVLWNGNDRRKYRVVISVEAWNAEMQIDGSKKDRKVENYNTLQNLLKEYICNYNKKAAEVYLNELAKGEGNPTQIGETK
jgi:hypothetical protein